MEDETIMHKKIITYDDLDQAVKASYELGLIDGRVEKKNQLEKLRMQLKNMLISNKQMIKLLLEEHRQDKWIKISPCIMRNIIYIVYAMKDYNLFHNLKTKYEKATGEKITFKKGELKYDTRATKSV